MWFNITYSHSRRPANCRKNSTWIRIVTLISTQYAAILFLCFLTGISEAVQRGAEQPNFFEKKTKTNVAMNILRNMNLSVNPCENFYQFACQGWHNDNPIPPSKDAWGIHSVVQKTTMKYLIDIMEEPVSQGDLRSWKNAHATFNSCVQSSSNDKVDCVLRIYREYPFIVGHKLATKMFRSSKIFFKIFTKTMEMFMNVKESLKRLREKALLNAQSISFTSQDVDDVPLCLGFPSWIFNKTRIQIEEKRIKQVSWFTLKYYYDGEKHGNKSHRCLWYEYPIFGAAAFEPSESKIYVKFEYIAHTFAQYGRHRALNFGSLGNALAHELGHAFYQPSEKAFQNGNLTSGAKCLMNQYNKLIVDELSNSDGIVFVNGSITLEENLADNIGLLLAYNSYKYMDKITYSQRSRLSGLEMFRDDQLFFIAYAQFFCGSYSREMLDIAVTKGVHTPTPMNRVLGVLQNSVDFGKSWRCPVGSHMNPLNKCNLLLL